RNQLAAGQVDSRLLLAIAALAGHQPISIVRFGNVGPSADATMPLRFADLAENDPAARMGTSAYVQSARDYLETVDTQFRPGGNGTGLPRTIRSWVSSVGWPLRRSSITRAPNRLAPTPSPVYPSAYATRPWWAVPKNAQNRLQVSIAPPHR